MADILADGWEALWCLGDGGCAGDGAVSLSGELSLLTGYREGMWLWHFTNKKQHSITLPVISVILVLKMIHPILMIFWSFFVSTVPPT